MAKPQELPDGEEPQEATPASRPTVRPLFASSNTKDCREDVCLGKAHQLFFKVIAIVQSFGIFSS